MYKMNPIKKNLNDLAILGGEPAFKEQLHVGCPNIYKREVFINRLNDIFDRRRVTNNGPYEQEFEKKVADFLKVKHCIAVCNGTIALEIAIRALNFRDEVIIPSFTFAATAHALLWLGIKPVFCDINPKIHNINPNLIEKLITPRTTGIIGVHLWGQPCDIDVLSEISKRNNLKLLFDAAHAFGCSYNKRMIGNFGDAEIFSFHATKFIHSFEGGAIVTNNDELATKAKLMRNFGFAGYDNVISLGINGKMTEISAAMGLTNLENIDTFLEINYRNYKIYQQELSNIPGINLLTYNEEEKHNYQYIVLDIDKDVTQISRDQLDKVLWAENILSRRYFYPACHRMKPYRAYFQDKYLSLKETEKIADRILVLPTGIYINPDIIQKICEIIRFSIKNVVKLKQLIN